MAAQRVRGGIPRATGVRHRVRAWREAVQEAALCDAAAARAEPAATEHQTAGAREAGAQEIGAEHAAQAAVPVAPLRCPATPVQAGGA